jgi:hypothetical protein
MQAEEELSSIFSKKTNQRLTTTTTTTSNTNTGHFMWSPNSAMTKDQTLTNGNFSKYGHFRAPIKRPSCNPIIKDERFKKINTMNENMQAGWSQHDRVSMKFERMGTCNLQDVNYSFQDVHSAPHFRPMQPFCGTGGHLPFSEATSPTAASGFTYFSLMDNSLTTSNSSWLSGSRGPLYGQEEHQYK